MKHFNSLVLAYLIVIGSPSITTAAEQAQNTTKEDVKAANRQAVDTTAAYVKQERDEFIAQSQRDLDTMKASIDELNNHIKTADKDNKKKFELTLQDLKKQQRVANMKLDELKAARKEDWKNFKAKVEKANNDLKQGYENAKAEFK